MEEEFDIFDEKNKPIGKEKRSIVHSKGLYHRSVNIFLFNKEGQLLLQKRSNKKDICPSAWDLSTAGHLEPGEPYSKAAKRELHEELGIKAHLKKIGNVHLQKNEYKNGKKDYEFVTLFKVIHNGPFKIDKEEVSKFKFFEINEIKKMIKKNRKKFTPWFLEEFEFFC